MKPYTVGRYVLFSIIGLLIFGAGLVLLIVYPQTDRILKTLPYILVGIGSGVFGSIIGIAIRNHAMRKHPQMAQQVLIDEKDERNQAIRNRAKARAYDLMLFVFVAILLAFTLVQVELYIILTLVAAYLFCVGANIYFVFQYQKEM